MLETINKTANAVFLIPPIHLFLSPLSHTVPYSLGSNTMWSCCCCTHIRRPHGHGQSSRGHVGGALVVVVHVVGAVIVEVVCVVPPRTEIGNMCRLCAVVGILPAYRGMWLPPPGS